MTKPADPLQFRTRLGTSALSAVDRQWLESLGFDDSAIPAVENAAQASDYERRSQALSALAGTLSLWERETAQESRLAAAIGARLADWKDRMQCTN